LTQKVSSTQGRGNGSSFQPAFGRGADWPPGGPLNGDFSLENFLIVWHPGPSGRGFKTTRKGPNLITRVFCREGPRISWGIRDLRPLTPGDTEKLEYIRGVCARKVVAPESWLKRPG